MTQARAVSRPAQARGVELHKTTSAALAIGPLVSGMERYCLTFGQFSLVDALEHLVEQAGPCELVVSTWTAARADAERAAKLLEDGRITRFRLLVDRSFVARQPVYCERVVELFGDDAIRTTRTHAKFAVASNEEWALAVRTSMNLKRQPAAGDDRGVRRPGARWLPGRGGR